MAENPFRHLPAVNDILEAAPVRARAAEHPPDNMVSAVRSELDEIRRRITHGEALDGATSAEAVAARVAQRLSRDVLPKLRPVINATGIVLHTNLGRAPVAEEAARAAYVAARAYLNLELDLETGKRSSRQVAIREWVCRLTRPQPA